MEEATRLLSFYNNETELESVALKALIVFAPLILQKPAKNSKRKEHISHVERRLCMWKNGEFEDLINEGKAIQRRIVSSRKTKQRSITKTCTNLILQGKIKAACKLMNRQQGGSLEINQEVMNALSKKHPNP